MGGVRMTLILIIAVAALTVGAVVDLTGGAVADLGTTPGPRSLSDLCDRYGTAVIHDIPLPAAGSTPPGFPTHFRAGLKASAIQSCRQQAVTLGYAPVGDTPDRVTLTPAQQTRLIGKLTTNTPVRVDY
jgi:hypothetical protein